MVRKADRRLVLVKNAERFGGRLCRFVQMKKVVVSDMLSLRDNP
jgi:hypothetical protein